MTVKADPYKYFRIEARELLTGLTQGVLDWGKGSTNTDLVPDILRLAHTLKGAARVVRQSKIAELAHALEEALVPYRDGAAGGPAEEVRAKLLGFLDGMVHELSLLENPETRVKERLPRNVPAASARVVLEEVDALLESVFQTGVRLHALRLEADPLAQSLRVAETLCQQLSLRLAPGGNALRTASLADDLRRNLERTIQRIATGMERTEAELDAVRERASRLRLLPANSIAASLERAVRDAAVLLNKRVEFEVSGGDNKLDAHVLEAVQDAMLHVVRNAVAHGIESETERAAKGKPATGRISLHIERKGDRISFLCSDDGQGLDLGAIRNRALEQNLISTGEGFNFGMQQAIEMISRGGFTTSPVVNEIAGHGIGLEVAAEVASRLKGNLAITSQPGSGLALELLMPVSLTSEDALFAEGEPGQVVIPLDAVGGVTRISENNVVFGPNGISVEVDGERWPYITLASMFGGDPRKQQSGPAIIVKAKKSRVVVGVDRLLGTHGALIRPLPQGIEAPAFVAGAILDADGNPLLVLNPEGILDTALAARATPHPAKNKAAPILIIDDSLTTRMLEQSILESAGYKVEMAVSAEQALVMAEAKPYSLFLVDVEMPGWSGFEFLEHARTVPSIANVPAILVTSRNLTEDRLRGERAGARDYIVKGEFDQVRLLETIRRLLEAV